MAKQFKWNTDRAAEISHRYAILKCKARIRGWTMSITQDEYLNLAFKPCDYCGGVLGKAGHGLDRIDNRIGYVLDNVVPCCGDCNEIKGFLEGAGFTYPRTVELMRELNWRKP